MLDMFFEEMKQGEGVGVVVAKSVHLFIEDI